MVNEKVIIEGLSGIIEKEIRNVVDNSANDNLENILRDKFIKLIKIGSIAGVKDEDYETHFKIVTSKVELDKMMMREIFDEIKKIYPSES
ncbi:MAG: hypothetical protein ACRC3I_01985 [Cetobacterium sp.]